MGHNGNSTKIGRSHCSSDGINHCFDELRRAVVGRMVGGIVGDGVGEVDECVDKFNQAAFSPLDWMWGSVGPEVLVIIL